MITLKIVNTVEDFMKLRKSWNSLLASSEHRNIFLTWEWLFTWWETVDKKNKRLEINLYFDGKKLVGICPAYLDHNTAFNISIVRFLGDSLVDSCYLDFIAHKSLYDTLTEKFFSRYSDNLIYLKYIDSASGLKKYRQRTAPGRTLELSRCPIIQLPASEKIFLESMSPKSRYNFRKSEKRILGELNGTVRIAKGNQLKKQIDSIFLMNEKRWANNRGLGAFSAEMKSFLKKVIERLGARAEAAILSLHDIDMAYILCFRYSDTLYAYSAAFYASTDNIKSFSLGSFLNFHNIRRAIGENIRNYDMGRGNLEYKSRLASEIKVNIGLIRAPVNLRYFSYSLLAGYGNRLSYFAEQAMHPKIKTIAISVLPKKVAGFVR